jgi:4-hydroxy-3-methylbut-2-enyl diphosphate reductase
MRHLWRFLSLFSGRSRVNRSLARERFKIAGMAPGEVLVITEFDHPERGPVRCSAAPAVSGWLRRRGFPVRQGPSPRLAPSLDSVLFTATYLDRDGHAVGLGAAAASPGLAAAAADAVRAWASVMRTRRAVLVATDPTCPGERDSLARVRNVLAAASRPVYIYRQLTRSRPVADDLKQHGAVFTSSLDRIPDGATVLFPAHGVPLRVRAEAAARGMRIIDTTCPLVTAAHERVRSYAERGDTVALIGRPGHAAVAGISGQAPENIRLISTAQEAGTLEVDDPLHLSYVVQTGIPVEDAAPVLTALRSRFPALRGPHPDQFCYAASDRLGAIRRAVEVSDVVIVAGARGCADSRQVLQAAAAAGAEAYLAGRADDIRPEWLDRSSAVGLTAGLGARPELTDEMLATLSGLGPLSVTRVDVSTEIITARSAAAASSRRPLGWAAASHGPPAAELATNIFPAP